MTSAVRLALEHVTKSVRVCAYRMTLPGHRGGCLQYLSEPFPAPA